MFSRTPALQGDRYLGFQTRYSRGTDRGTRGGGVALLIKKNIECTAFGGVQVNESIFCKLQLNGVSITVGAVYRPPNAPLSFLETLSDFLEGHIRDNTKVIIAGTLIFLVYVGIR